MAARLAQAGLLLLCIDIVAAGPLRRYANVTIAEDTCTSTLPASTTPISTQQTSLPLVVNGPTTLGFSLLSQGAITETGLSGAQANVATEFGMTTSTVSFTYSPETSATTSAGQLSTPTLTTAVPAATTTETTSTSLIFTYSSTDSSTATTTSTTSSVASAVQSFAPTTTTTFNTFPSFSNTTTTVWGTAYASPPGGYSSEASSPSAAESFTTSTAIVPSSQAETSVVLSSAVPSWPTFAYPLPSTAVTTTAQTAAATSSPTPDEAPAPIAATTTIASETDRPRGHHGRPTEYPGAASEGTAERTYSSGVPGITIVPLNPSVVYITTTVTETTGMETVTVSV